MSRIHINSRQHELPIAGVLNNPTLRENRSLNYKGIRLHVSDLIKSDTENKFCVREHVIKHLLKPTVFSGVLSASFDLLFDLGNCLHDNARNRWMLYDKDGRKRVLARWSCVCGDVKHTGVNPDTLPECARCGSKPIVFDEYEFADEEHGIIAHPDFIIVRGKGVIERGYFDKSKDFIHIVEIKGIDRQDLDWDTIDGPLGEHTIQGSMYHRLAVKSGYRVFDGISYLYGDRAVKKSLFRGAPWKEFILPPDDLRRTDRVFQKATDVINGVKSGVIPERTVCSQKDCQRAKGCPMANICFSIDGGRMEVKGAGKSKAKEKAREKDNSRKAQELGAAITGRAAGSYRVRPKPNRNRDSNPKRRG